MSSIPPSTAFSVLQSTAAQRTQSRVQDGEANRRADAARELASQDRQIADAVESSDADSRVNADGGGQGGQGRNFHPDEEAAPSSHPQSEDADTPSNRLDLTA